MNTFNYLVSGAENALYSCSKKEVDAKGDELPPLILSG